MGSSRSIWIVAVLVLCCSHGLAADSAGDAIKRANLTTAGEFYVLPDESPVLEKMKALRVTRTQADKEIRARTLIDKKIQEKRKVIKDAEKQWNELKIRLSLVTRPDIHNNIAARMNRLAADAKNAEAALKDLEEQAGKCGIAAKSQFVDDLLALKPRADAVAKQYARLSRDAALKAAINQANAAANPKLALGPSADFTAAVADLNKWGAEVESETIPLREDGGIHLVDVLVNGEHFVMGLDTGASAVSLNGEVAEQLKLVPTERDPVVHMTLADGNTIEGRMMTLKTVRVGRFTLEDVTCVVLQKGLSKAPLLLGGSFLNHFIVKIDSSTKQLHLTEIKQAGGKSPGPASSSAGAAGK